MAESGDCVRVHYVGLLDDGREFESSHRKGEPLEVRIGAGRLLPRVEDAICDMRPGERRIIHLDQEDAYGVYDSALIQSVPACLIPNADELPVGDYIEIETPAGILRAKVISADGEKIVLDCNHELAGQAVTFVIDLVSIVRETAIERELHPQGCGCGCSILKEQLTR